MVKLVRVSEAAKFLGVNPETLRRWDNLGKVKAYRNRINNYRLYDLKELSEFVYGKKAKK